MQPLSREQLNRNRYLRATSFEGKQDLGDTFRRARGDRDRIRAGAMAPIVDEGGAGENNHSLLYSSSTATVAPPALSPPPASVCSNAETDAETDVLSSCSSPPTHPAFFSPAPRKSPAQQQKTAADGEVLGPVMLSRLLENFQGGAREEGGGDDGGGRNMEVLGNVDTNVIAAQPNDNASGSSGTVSCAPGCFLWS